MTILEETAFARLEREGRLLNPVLKSESKLPGRFLFRGELALKFQTLTADEKRPPLLKAEQVLAVGQAGDATFPFLAAYLLSFESLRDVAEVLGDTLSPAGKYFIFCNNIDLGSKYQVPMGGVTFYVLPLDESTVYNEMLELLRMDKNDLKKLDPGGKVDAVADAARKFKQKYEEISFERGLEVMGPVRDPGENRPV